MPLFPRFEKVNQELLRAKKEAFLTIETPRQVASFFEIEYQHLVYRLYHLPNEFKYSRFVIPKKSNKNGREILAPTKALKTIQRDLSVVLQEYYQPKATVHGFVKKNNGDVRNIVSNSKKHSRQNYVLNLDLDNFFPTINFGRVRGLFLNKPFNFNEKVATVLAQICCFEGKLPQGAPTSPVISNLICRRLDSQIMALAKKCRCYYSRYADDITFSTSTVKFPDRIASISRVENRTHIMIGQELDQIIQDNGFKLNPIKTRIALPYQRQEVTGLTVNSFPNVNRKFLKQLRAMLHKWKINGLASAEQEYFEKYCTNHRNPTANKPLFKDIVKGRLNFMKMVRVKKDDRGKDIKDKLYDSYVSKYKKCHPNTSSAIKYDPDESKPLLICEGKTDWRHLKVAYRKLNQPCKCDIEFYESDGVMGGDRLLRECKILSKINSTRMLFCIFDRDDEEILSKISSEGKYLKHFGQNVYAFAIPVPKHRIDSPGISLEFYYSDEEIRRVDENGKRLFINTEFNKKSGKLILDESIICQDYNRFSRSGLHIISEKVYDGKHRQIAMSKSDFAENVYNAKSGFHDFNFSEFQNIFNVINSLVS